MTDSRTANVIDDPMLDEEWLAAPTKRSRLRTLLALTLAAALCFLGGAIVQKQFGTSSAAGSAAADVGGPGGGQLPEGLPEGFPEGEFPGGGQAPGGSDIGGDTTGQSDQTDSVIGKVVKVRGNVWIVEDLGGNRHEITVGDDTDVVRETSIKSSLVTVGDPVDIAGTSSDGQLQATEVTLR